MKAIILGFLIQWRQPVQMDKEKDKDMKKAMDKDKWKNYNNMELPNHWYIEYVQHCDQAARNQNYIIFSKCIYIYILV